MNGKLHENSTRPCQIHPYSTKPIPFWLQVSRPVVFFWSKLPSPVMATRSDGEKVRDVTWEMQSQRMSKVFASLRNCHFSCWTDLDVSSSRSSIILCLSEKSYPKARCLYFISARRVPESTSHTLAWCFLLCRETTCFEWTTHANSMNGLNGIYLDSPSYHFHVSWFLCWFHWFHVFHMFSRSSTPIAFTGFHPSDSMAIPSCGPPKWRQRFRRQRVSFAPPRVIVRWKSSRWTMKRQANRCQS